METLQWHLVHNIYIKISDDGYTLDPFYYYVVMVS